MTHSYSAIPEDLIVPTKVSNDGRVIHSRGHAASSLAGKRGVFYILGAHLVNRVASSALGAGGVGRNAKYRPIRRLVAIGTLEDAVASRIHPIWQYGR